MQGYDGDTGPTGPTSNVTGPTGWTGNTGAAGTVPAFATGYVDLTFGSTGVVSDDETTGISTSYNLWITGFQVTSGSGGTIMQCYRAAVGGSWQIYMTIYDTAGSTYRISYYYV